MEQDGDMDILALNIHLPDTEHLPEAYHQASKQ
jgi:hypothetical protein